MNLQELQENKKSKLVERALKEHYSVDLNLEKLDMVNAKRMLGRVRGLLKESRAGRSVHRSHENSSYLKLVMMEQALSDRLNDLREQAKIVLENEEVQKSQVILAAQDMIDSMQKMIEQVSKMNAEELPAVVEGIQNEFGVQESEQFNTSVSETLTTLQSSLSQAKTALTGALNGITGAAPAADMGMEMPGAPDMGAEPGMDAGGELPELPELPEPDEEPEDMGGAGRETR
jgi:hypothetical protein